VSRWVETFDGRGGIGRSLSWTVFGLVLLTHVSGAVVLRDYFARAHPVTPPQPIVVTLIEAEQALHTEAAPPPAGEQVPVPPRPQPAALPPTLPPPEPAAKAAPEPMAEAPAPIPPPPPPRVEPTVSELPPPPPPVPPEAVQPSAPPPTLQSPPIAAAPGPAQPPSPLALATPQLAAPASPVAAAAAASAPPSPPRVNAAYLDNPKPAYPLSARQRRLEGTVRLRVLISAAGTVEQIEVQQTSGSPALDRSALEAVKHWRFVPARRGEEAVPAWLVVPIVFTLKG
jgi:protein TonB